MLSKTQLFHLDKLKPISVQEANLILELLEQSLIFFIDKTGLCDLYNVREVYCNRKHIDLQRNTIGYGLEDSNKVNEYYFINMSIEKFVESIIDNYYTIKNTQMFTQLNLEVCFMSKSNLAVSYDLY